MSVDSDEPIECALVEVSPGTALVFGKEPEGLDLIPFSLVSPADQRELVGAFAASSAVLNVGGQLASGLAQARGLVRLSPETLQALKAGMTPLQSGGYNIGVLASQNGKFATQVRWLPADRAIAAATLANIAPTLTMLAIQVQLHEIAELVRENLALTETVLRTVRNEQWAELTGLEQAMTKALNEANAVGHVTTGVWENIAGYEALLRKQRDLFRRNVEMHSAELAKRTRHQERREYIEKSGEAIVLDLHSLLLAHKAWFEYQALRAGRAQLSARDDPSEQKLLETIVDNAREEYHQTVEQMTALLDAVNRELWILAELPGKRTIPFTGCPSSSGDVAAMAQQLLTAVERLSDSVRPRPAPLERPINCYVDEPERLDQDLRILRWQLDGDENLKAIATANEGGVGGVLTAVTQQRVLLAVTQQRVVIADLSEFRKDGVVRQSVRNDDIRYLRVRDDDGARGAEVDLITRDENFTWRFAKGAASAEVAKSVGALLADHMAIPEIERDSMRSLAAVGSGSQRHDQLALAPAPNEPGS